jgi:hypothetical protein
MPDKQWFAVRTVVMEDQNRPWGPHDLQPGQFAYEERITIWLVESPDAAIVLAEDECRRYVEDLGGEVLGLSQAYAMATKPSHSVEVFSLIRRSELMPDDYLDRHFDTGTEYQSREGL